MAAVRQIAPARKWYHLSGCIARSRELKFIKKFRDAFRDAERTRDSINFNQSHRTEKLSSRGVYVTSISITFHTKIQSVALARAA